MRHSDTKHGQRTERLELLWFGPVVVLCACMARTLSFPTTASRGRVGQWDRHRPGPDQPWFGSGLSL